MAAPAVVGPALPVKHVTLQDNVHRRAHRSASARAVETMAAAAVVGPALPVKHAALLDNVHRPLQICQISRITVSRQKSLLAPMALCQV